MKKSGNTILIDRDRVVTADDVCAVRARSPRV
jgi:hypothetical protein